MIMKLEENDNLLIFPNIQRPIIYLLLYEQEVVYVGQSKIGLLRPYSHKDKIFTDVVVIYCEENELDKKETDYIRKYKPKYNMNIGFGDFSFSKAREFIRKNTSFKNFSIFDLKKLIKKLHIETYKFKDVFYMTDENFKKIFNYVNSTKEDF